MLIHSDYVLKNLSQNATFCSVLAEILGNASEIAYLRGKECAMNIENIIGRKAELNTLGRLFRSDKSEFLAIYGRRRVGKSYLIDESFRDELAFSVVGIFKKTPNSI